MPRPNQTPQLWSAIGVALLALSSVLAYAQIYAPPQGSAATVETTANCANEGNPLDRIVACAVCTLASEGSSPNLSVGELMRLPPCVFRVLTDACNYNGATAVLWVPVLVVFAAIVMEQAISGFRGGTLLAFVLSGITLFATIVVLKGGLKADVITYLVLAFFAASFGGALAHWIVYIRDLLPVAALGLGLLGLSYLPSIQTPLPEPVAWATGALGGVWLYFWRRRTKSRVSSDGTKSKTNTPPGNGAAPTP